MRKREALEMKRRGPTGPTIPSVPQTGDLAAGPMAVTVLTAENGERQGRLVSLEADLERVVLETDPLPETGEAVVFYLPSGMRFVGTCSEISGRRVVLRLQGSVSRRSALAGGQAPAGVRRLRSDTDRQQVDDACVLRRENGEEHDCRVLDISLSGLFVATEVTLEIGEAVTVGRAQATVVRRGAGGYGMAIAKGQTGADAVADLPAKERSEAEERAERFAAGLAPRGAASA
jgi:hypothetical protein